MTTQAEISVDTVVDNSKNQPSSNWLSFFQLASILRLAGSSIVIVAIGIFLFQNWQTGDDLTRYGMLLGETLTLSVLGFAISVMFKEPKSARMLLGLGLISTAASVTVLAALLYSQIQWDTIPGDYPAFAIWKADSLAQLSWLIPASLALLLPASWIGLRVMARPLVKRLMLLFALGLGLLLMPVRDPNWIITLAGFGSILMLQQGLSLRTNHSEFRTPEGAFAQALLLLPMAIMLVRSMSLYASDGLTNVLISSLVYVLLRQIHQYLADQQIAKLSIERLGIIASLFVSFSLFEILDDNNLLISNGGFIELGLILAAFFTELAMRSEPRRPSYLQTAAWIAVIGSALSLTLAQSIDTVIMMLIVTSVGMIHAWAQRRVLLLIASGGTFITTFGYQISELVMTFDFGGWGSIALLGMGVIVLAAIVERHGERWKAMVLGMNWQN